MKYQQGVGDYKPEFTLLGSSHDVKVIEEVSQRYRIIGREAQASLLGVQLL
jgi:hypothetical protein